MAVCPKVFAVGGATGRVGGCVMRSLLGAGHTVRALVRDPDAKLPRGVASQAVDFFSRQQLVEALTGVDGVFMMMPPNYAQIDPIASSNRMAQNIRHALDTASVPKVVTLSCIGAQFDGDDSENSSSDTLFSKPSVSLGTLESARMLERALMFHQDGPVCEGRVTSVRAAWLLDNWLGFAAAAAQKGIFPLPMAFSSGATVPHVAKGDVGDVVARELANDSPATRIVQVEGVNVSAMEIAAALSVVLNRQVDLALLEDEFLEKILRMRGFSDASVELYKETVEGLASGAIQWQPPGDIEHYSVQMEPGDTDVLDFAEGLVEDHPEWATAEPQ